MIEKIGQAGVDVGQAQRREAEGNLFGGRALLIMVQDRVQTDPAASDPDRAVLRSQERHRLR